MLWADGAILGRMERLMQASQLCCICPGGALASRTTPAHILPTLAYYLPQMVDEDPYKLPTIDESKWFIGGHLGSQIQSCNWQVGAVCPPIRWSIQSWVAGVRCGDAAGASGWHWDQGCDAVALPVCTAQLYTTPAELPTHHPLAS